MSGAAAGCVGEAELASIVEAIWTCTLGTADAPTQSPEVAAAGPWLRAGVGITGGWDGVVTVECSRSAAVTATSYMLALDAALVAEADVCDALGELANVVGGGVKSLLPARNRLTLPVVAAVAPGVAASGGGPRRGDVPARADLAR